LEAELSAVKIELKRTGEELELTHGREAALGLQASVRRVMGLKASKEMAMRQGSLEAAQQQVSRRRA